MGMGWRYDAGTQMFFRDWWEADAAKLLGIDNAAAEKNFMLYPNPSNGLLHVKTAGVNAGAVACNVYSIDGKLVHSGKLQNDNTIDLSNKQPGTYIFELVVEGQQSRQIFSIE